MLISLDAQSTKIAGGEGEISALPLKLKDYHRVLRFVIKANPRGPGNTQEENSQAGMSLVTMEGLDELCRDIFPKYVTAISGLQIQEKGNVRDATLDDILSVAQFSPIVFEILFFLVNISSLTENDKKK